MIWLTRDVVDFVGEQVPDMKGVEAIRTSSRDISLGLEIIEECQWIKMSSVRREMHYTEMLNVCERVNE